MHRGCLTRRSRASLLSERRSSDFIDEVVHQLQTNGGHSLELRGVEFNSDPSPYEIITSSAIFNAGGIQKMIQCLQIGI